MWCGRTVGRTDGRAGGRAGGRAVYGHVITKFSQMGSLPHFFTHGAPLPALRARELRYNADRKYRQSSLIRMTKEGSQVSTFQRCHCCELSKFGIFETNRVVHIREVFVLFNFGIETEYGFVSMVTIEL